MKNISLLLSIAGLCLTNAFVPKASVGLGHMSSSSSSNYQEASTTTTAMRAMDVGMIQEMETARAAFVLCFAGALGTAAVGREGELRPIDSADDLRGAIRHIVIFRQNFSPVVVSFCVIPHFFLFRHRFFYAFCQNSIAVIPVTLRELKKVNALKGQGRSSMSGEKLDLFGYPEAVYSDDIKAILNNNMTVYEIVSEYPIEGQLPGYLRFESLAQANAEVSQIAVRALFDSIAIGLNKNSVAPSVAAEKLELYKREGLDMMTSNSRLNKTIGVSALVILLGLLGAADYFAIFHLFHGWFPEWSGTAGLPFSLLDFGAYSSLPSCFMNDIPPLPVASGAFPMN